MSRAYGSTTVINISEPISVLLSNEHHTLTANSDGTVPSYDGASTKIQVFCGSEEVTENCVFSCTESVGVTGTLSGNTYLVTELTTDNGYVDLKSDYYGMETVSRFSLSKSKTGTSGSDAATIVITCTNQIFKKNKGESTYSPETITMKPEFNNCTFGKWQYYSGAEWIDISENSSSSSLDGNDLIVSKDYDYNSSASSITFRCVDSSGNYYDTMTIVKVSDGDKGDTGTSLVSYVEQYAKSMDKNNPPAEESSDWIETYPSWENGYYLWTRTMAIYENPSSVEYLNYKCDTTWELVTELEIGGTNLLLNSRTLMGDFWAIGFYLLDNSGNMLVTQDNEYIIGG